MSKIVIGSINCRGLADKLKRNDIFEYCKERYDISILVDTHSCKDDEKMWFNEWNYISKFSSWSSRSRGVAILFKNTFDFKIHDEYIDTNGNFIILDISVQDYRFNLVALYGPNEDKPEFFQTLNTKIHLYQNTSSILVGDWNVVQDYKNDTLNYRGENNPKSKQAVKDMMIDLDIIDIWRVQHPDLYRYSWRGPFKKQARLDYFCVSSDFEAFVVTSDIGISYRSDHSPVSIELKFINQVRGQGTWKFNNSLLKYPDFVDNVKQLIRDVTFEYEVDSNEDPEEIDKRFVIDYQLFWETVKMKIRGLAISCASFHKKRRDIEEQKLLKKLGNLNEQFLQDDSENIRNDIEQCERELKCHREEKIKGIMVRAKAKWQVEGERNSKFFCNLEKKHYTEKTISRVMTDDNQIIQDPKQILEEQKLFYEKLYKTSGSEFENIHKELFLDDTNPFISKPIQEEIDSCEGNITVEECLLVLKNMKNFKSPGLDGFTVEFYKFFWNDIKYPLVRCLNEGLLKERLSVSQRQGIITCLPKDGKVKHFLKNWRPITLLCVDYKLASACIANRLKPVLQNIISHTQKGFLKGRFMGECIRLIYDLLDKLEDDDIPGLLLLIDFEKAFDTVEWPFLQKTLDFYGFGPTLCRWIRAFYTDITSAVVNNGHMSKFFDLGRGVRQGDPLSPYLFILVLELLSSALKYDPLVSGVTIEGSEYLLSQYADDSTLILNEESTSLERALDIFGHFSVCAGLRVNLDKTEAIWVGSRKGCNINLLPDKQLAWNFTGKFKILGVLFDIMNNDMTKHNFTCKLEKVRNILNSWCGRDLTYIGRTIVIKTLAMPVLVQILTVLPNPPVPILKDIQNIFYKFLWENKPDKIKRNVIINEYEEGGLKFPCIEAFGKALKMTWLQKVLDPLNHSPWKTLLFNSIDKYGGDKILFMNKEGLEYVSRRLNPFWRDILQNFAEISQNQDLEGMGEWAEEQVLKQPIWLNKHITYNGNLFIRKEYCANNIFFVNDLVGHNSLLSYEEFKNKYHYVDTNFLEYYGITCALPPQWKRVITGLKLDEITNELISRLKKDKKPCKYFRKIFTDNISETPERVQLKWEFDLEENFDNWNYLHSLTFRVTKNTKLQNFQFRLVHRILGTNSFLYKCKIKETELCTFCNEAKETFLHLFYECFCTKNIWLGLIEFLNKCGYEIQNISAKEVIFDDVDILDQYNTVNHIILLAKYYIYRCRCTNTIPTIKGLLEYLKYYIRIEKISADYVSPSQKDRFIEKWVPVETALGEQQI